MLNKIDISDEDTHVFQFDAFEFVLHKENSYILCEEGYFAIEGLHNFKKIDESTYIIINEEEDKFIIDEDDFEKIKEIYINFT